MYSFHSDDEIKHFINSEVINTSEVCQILKCTRQNVDDLVRRNKLVPIKTYPRDKLFFKKDVLERIK